MNLDDQQLTDVREILQLARHGAITVHYEPGSPCRENSRFVTCQTPGCVDRRNRIARVRIMLTGE